MGISFRLLRKFFFANCIEKCELLSSLLHNTSYNLEESLCPVFQIFPLIILSSSNLHTKHCNKDVLSNHFVNRKAKILPSVSKAAQRKWPAILTTYLSHSLKIFTCVTPLDDQPVNFSTERKIPAYFHNTNRLTKRKDQTLKTSRNAHSSFAITHYTALLSSVFLQKYSITRRAWSFWAFIPIIDNLYQFQFCLSNRKRVREHLKQFNYGYQHTSNENSTSTKRAANPLLESSDGQKISFH